MFFLLSFFLYCELDIFIGYVVCFFFFIICVSLGLFLGGGEEFLVRRWYLVRSLGFS